MQKFLSLQRKIFIDSLRNPQQSIYTLLKITTVIKWEKFFLELMKVEIDRERWDLGRNFMQLQLFIRWTKKIFDAREGKEKNLWVVVNYISETSP